MGFLDKPISELSLAELQRLIRQEVSAQVPAIPTGVLALSSHLLPVTTDGAAPNSSPAVSVVSSIGVLVASWTSITNADAVAYKVYIDTSGPTFTPVDSGVGTNLYGVTAGTHVVLRTLADGVTPLSYGTTYYVRVKAFDDDGDASAAGTAGSGSPSQAGAVDLSVGSLSAISANMGTLTSGSIVIGSDRTVTINNTGITLADSTGAPVVVLPTDSAQPSTFYGSVVASALTSQSATLNNDSYLAAGGTLHLMSGVSQPLTGPSLSLVTLGSLTASTRYYLAYSWYDGVHETQISPVASISTSSAGLNLKTIGIVLPNAPTGATQARIYMDTASFATGAGHLQTAVAVSGTASTSVNITSFAGAGAASSASNTFPAGSASVQRPNNPLDSAGNPYSWTIEGNGRIRFLGPTINAQFWDYDDFFAAPATQGQLFEQQANAGGTPPSLSAGTSTNVNPGVMTLNTGNGATASDCLATASTTGGTSHNVIGTGVGRIRFSCYFGTGTIPNGTEQYNIQLGLSTNQLATSLGAANSQIAFVFTDGAALSNTTGKFGLVVGNGAAATFKQAVDAAGNPLTLASNTYYFVEWEVNPAGSNVDWWVSGVKQTAFTTNIPSAMMAIRMGITKAAGTTSRALNLDAYSVYGDYVS